MNRSNVNVMFLIGVLFFCVKLTFLFLKHYFSLVIHLLLMSVGRQMVSRVKDNNPLGTPKDFDKE